MIETYHQAASVKWCSPLGNVAVLRRAYGGTWADGGTKSTQCCGNFAGDASASSRTSRHISAYLKAIANVKIFLGVSVEKRRKTALSGLREGYPWDCQEYLANILLWGKLAPFFFSFSTYIPRNILRLASTLKDRGIDVQAGGSTPTILEKFTAPPCFKSSTPQAFSRNTARVFLTNPQKFFSASSWIEYLLLS